MRASCLPQDRHVQDPQPQSTEPQSTEPQGTIIAISVPSEVVLFLAGHISRSGWTCGEIVKSTGLRVQNLRVQNLRVQKQLFLYPQILYSQIRVDMCKKY